MTYLTPEDRVGSLVDEVRDGQVSTYLKKATELCEYIRKLEDTRKEKDSEIEQLEMQIAGENW
jgi:hypothetical protein